MSKENLNPKKRNSSVMLSEIKVKNILAEKGIFNLKSFELRYDEWCGNVNGALNTTPKKVWTGIKVANNRAKNIASFLGVSVLELLPDSESPWESLIYDTKKQKKFMTFNAKNPGQFDLIILGNCDDDNVSLNKHKVTAKCHLRLEGERGDHYFIVIRSKQKFVIMAPVSGNNYSNKHASEPLKYPQNNNTFSFDQQEGLGFRELIAIRIPHPFSFNRRSNKTGYNVTFSELNSLASSLLSDQSVTNSIAISSYPFILTD